MTSKIGPKEAAARAQREERAKELIRNGGSPKPLTKEHKMMIDDGLPPSLVRTGGSPKLPKRRDADPGVSLALPRAVQKAIEKDLAGDSLPEQATAEREVKMEASESSEVCTYPQCGCAVQTSTEEPEPTCPKGLKRPTEQKAEEAPAADTTKETTVTTVSKSKKKAKSAKAAKSAEPKSAKNGSKTEKVAALLQRKEGCTVAEVLKATGWTAVSMPAMAKAAGLKLKKEKDGKVTRYHAA